MDEPIRVMKEGKVARLFLNRPQAFNAFDLNMIQQFSECLITLLADDTVGAVVISGEGKAFCAGEILRWAFRFSNGPAAGFHELAARFHQAILEIVG